MAKMLRNKAKAGIDAIADAADKNKRPGARVAAKVESAADRAGDKIKQAGRAMKAGAQKVKAKAKRAVR